jgi:benzil reductase ((S)-benzoin forming)
MTAFWLFTRIINILGVKKYFIITGASKGLGKAFANSLLKKDNTLFLISRNPDEGISRKALLTGSQVHNISFDLSETDKISHLAANIFDHINTEGCGGVYLINNAAVIEPVMPVDLAMANDLSTIIDINFKAPVLLSSCFIKHSRRLSCDRKILNITSGASTNPHHGLSMYGSTKAALDMFTRSIGLEQENTKSGIQIHAISPGFVDTQMPQRLTQKDVSEFGSAQKFAAFRAEGKFQQPDVVAEKILELWQSGELKNAVISHLNTF